MTAGRRWRWSVLRERGSQPQRTLRTERRFRPSSRVWQRDGQTCWTRPVAGKSPLQYRCGLQGGEDLSISSGVSANHDGLWLDLCLKIRQSYCSYGHPGTGVCSWQSFDYCVILSILYFEKATHYNITKSKKLQICLVVNTWFGNVIGGVPQQHVILWLFPVFSFHLCVALLSTTVLKERIVSLLLVSVVYK